MSFLAPRYIPALTLAATIPPLVLLYFLKLKRREMPIASTLLWRRAVQDLRVNSPFQRLRSNLLLFLQLLVLILAALAIWGPIRQGAENVEQTMVLMIDQSGSMNTRESTGQTRLQLAREQALEIVDSLEASQRAMVIAFASRARVLAPFTGNKEELRQAIRSVQPTDEPGRLTEAMKLAEAHSTPLGEDPGAEAGTANYKLFTDGRLPDAGEVAVQRGQMDVTRIGRTNENVGIVDLDVRRNYELPEQVNVFARIRNFGENTVSRDVSLFIDGELKDARNLANLAPPNVSLKPGEPAKNLGQLALVDLRAEGSEATAAFEIFLDRAGEVEVRLVGQDGFAADDRASAIVTAPRALSVLLVTPGNRYLRDLLEAMPVSKFEVWTPQQYEDAAKEDLLDAGRCKFDVVVIDAHATDRLPPGNYIFFGQPPLIEEIDRGPQVTTEVFLDWDDTHPVLRHVAVEGFNVFSWMQMKLPPQARTLIESTSGPVLALLSRERHQFLICAFSFFDETRELLNTDWVFQESLVVFMHNALRYLAGSSASGQIPPVRPGEAFTVAAKPGVSNVTVRRPDDRSESIPVRNNGLAVYGQTDRVGIYRIDTGIPGEDARAVNLLDEQESFIAPYQDFHVASGQLTQGDGTENLRRPLWPFVLMALGAVLLLEWIIYNKRVFI